MNKEFAPKPIYETIDYNRFNEWLKESGYELHYRQEPFYLKDGNDYYTTELMQKFEHERIGNEMEFIRLRWISVDEQLPPPHESVIAYFYPIHPVMEGRVVGMSWRLDPSEISPLVRNAIDKNGFKSAAEVTHWMPIPPLPKEK